MVLGPPRRRSIAFHKFLKGFVSLGEGASVHSFNGVLFFGGCQPVVLLKCGFVLEKPAHCCCNVLVRCWICFRPLFASVGSSGDVRPSKIYPT